MPTCKTYLGSTERRKRLVSLKKCPDCTKTHEGNCIVTYKCRICLDGAHLDYLCPGPKTPNAQKRLTDGLGKSSKLTEVTKGQDLTYLEKEALDSKEVKVMSYSIGKKEHKTDPDIGIDQKLHAKLQETETKINEQKLQIDDLNSKLENYALAYNNLNSQLQISTEQNELALQTTIMLQNTLLDQHIEMNKLLTDNRQKGLQLEQYNIMISNQFSNVMSPNLFYINSFQERNTACFREYPKFCFRPLIEDLDTGQNCANYSRGI